MGNKYNNQLHPQSLYHKNTFLPMLCRVSNKDVRISQFKDHSSSFSDREPSSPMVSCMGQVKRNNKVIGFPPPYRLNSSTTTSTNPSKTSINHSHIKYTNHKKLFSGKNVITGTTTTATTNGNSNANNVTACGSRSCTSRREIKRNVITRKASKKRGDCMNSLQVNIIELDPPLPVIKKVQQPGTGRDEVNLWKRRFGGAALNGLKIEQIHLPNKNNLPPTIV